MPFDLRGIIVHDIHFNLHTSNKFKYIFVSFHVTFWSAIDYNLSFSASFRAQVYTPFYSMHDISV